MKNVRWIAVLLPILAGMAAAQDDTAVMRMKLEAEKVAAQAKILSFRTGVGNTVKNAPYSAVEVSEDRQTLGDGTNIHHETQVNVFRDSEGRTRRENGNEVTIFDPVGQASYVLDTKAQTARKLPLGTYFFQSGPNVAAGGVFTVRMSEDAAAADHMKRMVVESDMKVAEAKLATARAANDAMVGAKLDAEKMAKAVAVGGARGEIGLTTGVAMSRVMLDGGKSESLGKQNMQGVLADGTRMTSVIEAGAIGNDRALNIVNERWYSSELQTLVQSKHSDPRTGEENFRLINLSRNEPPAYLFQVPAGYQMLDRK